MDRRKFIKYAGCGAMTSTTMMSSLLNLKAMSAAALSSGAVKGFDYQVKVCLGFPQLLSPIHIPMPTGSYVIYNCLLSSYKRPRVRG